MKEIQSEKNEATPESAYEIFLRALSEALPPHCVYNPRGCIVKSEFLQITQNVLPSN